MLFTIAVILLVLWLLGLVPGYTMGTSSTCCCDCAGPVRGGAGQRSRHRLKRPSTQLTTGLIGPRRT